MNKVVLDFIVVQTMDQIEQDVAVMPANLAKKLLKDYAQKLIKGTTWDVVNPLANKMIDIAQGNGEVKDAVQACLEFIQERTLIESCAKEHWDNYKVTHPISA